MEKTVSLKKRRLHTEFQTIKAMVDIYCNDHHDQSQVPCSKCSELLRYAEKRLFYCPFQENKPTCGKCTIHCYNKEMREFVKEVMRYSGPKMMYKHPVMAIRHLLDGFRKSPETR